MCSSQTFSNDFPALLPHAEEVPQSHPLLKGEPVTGACDVIVYNPRHDLLMARMSREQIRAVIKEWRLLYDTRGHQQDIHHVQIFEVRISCGGDVHILNMAKDSGCYDGLL